MKEFDTADTDEIAGVTGLDCVKNAALFLDEEAVLAYLERDPERTEPPDAETLRTLDRLLRCLNLVVGEIAAEYAPVKTAETVEVRAGLLKHTDLKEAALDVYAVRRGGRPVAFRRRYDGIPLPDGAYEVEYSFLPGRVGIEDALRFGTAKISARLIGYGVAAEYALISGLSEEAVVYDRRYKDALAAAGLLRTERKVRERRWL